MEVNSRGCVSCGHEHQCSRAVFSTCAELASIKRSADSISVRMPGFRGPFEPASEQRKANKERHVFLFHDGVVTENDKPVE